MWIRRFGCFWSVISLLSCLITVVDSSRELARGKPTSTVEQYAARFYWNASRVVDGDTNTNVFCNSCLHTEPNNRDNARWQVNLEGTFFISRVEIFNAEPYFPRKCTGKVTDYVEGTQFQESDRLKGFIILLSDNPSIIDIDPCFREPSGDGEYPSLYQIVSCVGIGSYLTIYNEHRATCCGLNGAALVICEVKVYGCPIGTFGPDCVSSCPNCVSQLCNPDTGTCINGCNDGWTGDRCDRICDSYWYGRNCSMRCGNCINNETCLFTNGSCTRGCADGWIGEKCLEPCESDYFGPNCTLRCGMCRDNAVCAHTNGSCPGGCMDGYTGDTCKTKCTPGTYGFNCRETCGNCQNGEPCHYVNGTCLDNCAPGFIGALCKTGCSPGTYGFQCAFSCGNCYDNETCGPVDGKCLSGCKVGYMDSICKTVCRNGTYGSNCETQCGECLGGAACNIYDGSCTYGCAAGWSGVTCQRVVTLPPPAPFNPAGLIISLLIIIVIVALVTLYIWRRKKNAYKGKVSSSDRTPMEGQQTGDGTVNFGKNKNTYENTQYVNAAFIKKGENETERRNTVNKDVSRRLSDRIRNSFKRKTSQDQQIEEQIYSNVSAHPTEIELQDLKREIIEKRQNGVFKEEFQSLPTGAVHPHDAGKLPENKLKNRFLTTFPYDHSLVRLPKINNKFQSDYINANYIQDVDTPNVYIATQGPKKCTLFDFWRMVWENEVGKIVMLTNLVEGAKTKCILYWPDTMNHPVICEHLEIKLKSETVYGPFTMRCFAMTNKKEGQTREIWHHHFTAWPDHGVPDPMYLVLFHHVVSLYKTSLMGPTIVHCSAGIGRTGSYIALDALLRSGIQRGKVDVYDFAKTMRKDRMSMIQTLDQYIMVHESILEEYMFAVSPIPKAEFSSVLGKNNSPSTSGNRCRKEFNTLNVFRPTLDDKSSAEALLEENLPKNRVPTVLPDRRYRPYLLSQPANQNDYINAVILPGMRRKATFITTQFPLQHTVADFWYLVYDQDSDFIVVLEPNEENVDLFPSKDKAFHFRDITVYTDVELKPRGDLQEREMFISKKGDETARHITIIEFPAWTWRAGVPANQAALMKLMQDTKEYTESECAGPVTVVCYDGATKCGLFCALCNTVERLEETDEIDILFAVRQLQLRQPQIISTFEQYEFCYKQLHHYLESGKKK